VINYEKIKRLDKSSYIHNHSKDGYITSSSRRYVIWVDWGEGFRKLKEFRKEEGRDEYYNKIINRMNRNKIDYKMYENNNILLIINQQYETGEYKCLIGEMFSKNDEKISYDGLYEIKEYKNENGELYGNIDFTPLEVSGGNDLR
jgi:hypothetical protein